MGRQLAQGHRHPEWWSQCPLTPSEPPPAPSHSSPVSPLGDGRFIFLKHCLHQFIFCPPPKKTSSDTNDCEITYKFLSSAFPGLPNSPRYPGLKIAGLEDTLATMESNKERTEGQGVGFPDFPEQVGAGCGAGLQGGRTGCRTGLGAGQGWVASPKSLCSCSRLL